MEISKFYEKEMNNYSTHADGLYYQDEHLAYCDLKVAKIEAQYDLKTNACITTYFLYAEYPNGRKTECNAAFYSRQKKHIKFDGMNTITALSFH